MFPPKQLGISKILIILIIVGVLIVAGGVYWWQKQNQLCIQVITPAKNPITGECKEFSTPCNVPIGWQKVNSCPQSQDETAGWQIYNNTNINYSFKYPTEWNAATNQYNNKNSLFGSNASETSGLGGVEVYEYSGSIDEFIKYMESSADVRYSATSAISVNGLAGEKVQYSGTASKGNAVLLKSNNEIFNIYIASQDPVILEGFDLLVSTFKITSTVQTAGWKEFKNEFVSYQYPADWNVKGGIIYSADKTKRIYFSYMRKDQINKDIKNIYEYSKSIEVGSVYNEKTIQIGNLIAKTYDVSGSDTLGSYSRVLIDTQNYLYDFQCTPNASDETISKILGTVKILKN